VAAAKVSRLIVVQLRLANKKNVRLSASLRVWFRVLKEAVFGNERDDFAAVMLRQRFRLIETSADACQIDCGSEDLLSDEEQRKFARYAIPIADQLLGMRDANVRELMLASYLEKCADVVWQGNDCLLVQFMQSCL
jgi:hypothetical protein